MYNKEAEKIKIVPENYSAVTPWVISPSTEKLIEFLKEAFDAEEIPNSIIKNEEGSVIHAVIKIGDAILLLFDAREGWAPTPVFLNLYVEDIDKSYQRALASGATSVTDITTLWFGEKVCRVLDPFGNLWWINQRIEEVDFTNPEEVQKRASTPEAIAKIGYIQQSLDEAVKIQQHFLKIKTED
ncbi:VOC family protein [Chitinophaga sp.]|uniref:VOC family protein n=1 Tax=Chitinophaga sp. TaxID=1869181 RepID=UPI0031E3EAE1